ncbi:MAG: hypothetical protein RI909_123 [Bacteroidota bacterium]|jgi:uncharacterized damage-inducible protein DinB
MKTSSAKHLIDTLENQVETHIHDAVKIFQNLSSEILLKPAANGGWSIAQCLWHLNSYGDYYLPKIQSGLARNYPFNPDFKSTWLGSYFTRIMKPGSQMKKYKAFKNHVPPVIPDAHQVVAEFIQQQEQLLAYLKQARQTDLNRVRISISIMRWLKLKLGDVFQFIIAHDERHLQQAKRNL